MPSAALRAAHCLSTGRHAGRRPAAARGIAYCLLAVALLAPAGAAAADDCLQQIALQPGRSVDVVVSASRLLIEEVGTDIEYRWNTGEDFTAVATPPDRLGFDVLAARSPTLTLRIRGGQGGGQIRIGSCLDDADATFFSGLAALQTRSLEAGRDAARAALPALTYLRRWPLDARHAGWISSAHANILTSAGENNAAETAFLDSSRDWQQAGRPDRAAIALMAAGDNASRANRFDVAREWLTQARDELERLGVTYYALRSEGSLCTVLARGGRYRDAIACEERVIARWNTQQEKREAAVREISLANLWLTEKNPDEAQAHFLKATEASPFLPPLLRARLAVSLGNYRLSLGDLSGAAKLFAQSAQWLESNGLPAEQANVDLKLASLARLAGAVPEQIRLLQDAQERLSSKDDPRRTADIATQLSAAQLQIGEAGPARESASLAARRCAAIDAEDCRSAAVAAEIHALLSLNQIEAARGLLDDLESAHSLDALLALAEFDLKTGRYENALARINVLRTEPNDGEGTVGLSILHARALNHLGSREQAQKLLEATLAQQTTMAAGWQSAALRISARSRLARVGKELFDLVSPDADRSISRTDAEIVERTIRTLSARRLFSGLGESHLDPDLRKRVSASLLGGSSKDQRELLIALTNMASRSTTPEAATGQTEAATAGLQDSDLVVIPLAGVERFKLILRKGRVDKQCLELPVERYYELVERFDAALDGDNVSVSREQAAAEDLFESVRGCFDGMPSPRWYVVHSPGTPQLPWEWIAASGPAAEEEPVVINTFTVPTRQTQRLRRPRQVLLLDLDMPDSAPLPFASGEIKLLVQQFDKLGIATRHLRAADRPSDTVLAELSATEVAHIVGHANPASFGQIYQGLWYEAQGEPSLLTYPELVSTKVTADLIVLSACGTRANEQRKYGATSNISEALIAAGARHVVAAGNPLSDTAAPIWTRRFHEIAWSTGDAAVASKQARAVLRQTLHFRHPKFWAGIEYFAACTDSAGFTAGTNEP
ncbi:CHAT domain-containing protein [Tahibacter sp. UC22_41]|uniref:CHAT domain-containing protein n=1 Tax=Tahibacter sp. UC22_41 TaxID=3350178 RepID=UPI0036DDCADA